LSQRRTTTTRGVVSSYTHGKCRPGKKDFTARSPKELSKKKRDEKRRKKMPGGSGGGLLASAGQVRFVGDEKIGKRVVSPEETKKELELPVVGELGK